MKGRSQEQKRLWVRTRFELGRLGASLARFPAYWNFIQQAEKVQRSRLADFGPGGSVLVLAGAKEQAWRALVEKYVRDGLDRRVLVALLFRILSVKLQ